MAAVLAFDTSVTSKILPGGKGVVGSLFQALTGTVSSYEHISTGKAAQQVNVSCPKRLRCLICNKL
ncbi:ribulose-1,5-bisphosphate carboxylase/oxygenase activase protein [Populus alba x Populus x berolinensis]|nr:ribulose-1,5-bisphosphate carboxylase/oxygenase activase protein [Populus alba x Populus x berolinensis]